MSISPKKAREILLQILFALETGDLEREEMVSLLMGELKVTRRNVEEAIDKALVMRSRKEGLDSYMRNFAQEHVLEKIGKLEWILARLLLDEVRHDALSPSIAIAEGIRLARKFSAPEAGPFIHALLDALFKEVKGNAPVSAC